MPVYTLEMLSDAPILLFTVSENYRIMNDLGNFIADATKILDTLPERVYFINDLSRHHRVDMDDLFTASHQLASDQYTLYHHPSVLELLVITTDPILRLAFEGADSEAFAHLHTRLFDTLDEALAYVGHR
jgi:hypothetical protein